MKKDYSKGKVDVALRRQNSFFFGVWIIQHLKLGFFEIQN
jgi:hypothetical protein